VLNLFDLSIDEMQQLGDEKTGEIIGKAIY
jgi:hypothetical protein